MRFARVVLVCSALFVLSVVAQSPNGAINGQVLDPSGSAIADAGVVIVNDVTGLQYTTKTNDEGIYVLANLPPGPYRLQVSKVGFKTLIKPDIILNVQDALAISFTLPVGALAETVTVEGGAPLVNTESAAVSTVVDRQFAENLPMNGRSFQTLIQLTPGVVSTVSNTLDSGQFSINGQRASSNYWMVDGVSANFGIGTQYAGNGLGGSLPSFSVLGGTNSLVSVDALQEFRIQTSTYAPEFGRTPGGQISIVTRSGGNHFHGTAFNYFRNDALDANDWFAANQGQTKPEERQNDFGGTLSGRILTDRTFFFFSYEGLRLRLPQFSETTVPDIGARNDAVLAIQPFLRAYPLPNGPEVLDSDGNPTGAAGFNASFSNRSALDAYSLRLDHKLNNRVSLFGRYNYSPSDLVQRGAASLNTVVPSQVTTQTATVGTTWMITPRETNDLRVNYSRTTALSHQYLDNFGGATPLGSSPFPSPFTDQNAAFQLYIFSLANGSLDEGNVQRNVQRQVNLVDNMSIQKGAHSLKIGVDFRRLSPLYEPRLYQQSVFFGDVPAAESGTPLISTVYAYRNATLLFRNLSLFAQDTWRASPRLTLNYGLRWDVDFTPSSINGPGLPSVTNFDSLSQLNLARPGTPAFATTFDNVAPRVGVAFQLSQSPEWQTVLRGGFGVFYDLATQEVGNTLSSSYPFGAFKFVGATFPLDSASAAPPSISPASLQSGILYALKPDLKLPYTLQWNLALEQAIGSHQTISASYIGSVGRRLIQSTYILNLPNPDIQNVDLVGNTATSDYNALQIQFQRRMAHGLQALASYTLAHSIDTASAGSAFGNAANASGINPGQNRGPSDFDIRSSFSGGLTYDIPAPRANAFANAMLRGWSIDSVVQTRTAPPINPYDSAFSQLQSYYTQVRLDVVQGVPLYLYGPQYPGGKILNNRPSGVGPNCKGPFCPPPTDSNGVPLRQGNLGRNALRAFGAAQWDCAVHRDFPIGDSLKMQFRAEIFNLLNHPSFAAPVADISNPLFGESTQMLGRSLGGNNLGGGGLSSLYQIGGPRSIQLALKLQF